MTTVLGVDGGQSGIRLKHSEQAAIVEVDGVSRLEGDTVQAVADAVAAGWALGSFAAVDRVVLGLTTAPLVADDANRLCSLVCQSTGASEVWLADDTVTSHAGALTGMPGVSLVVGTGVACLAVPTVDDPVAIDGHGYLLGDSGGGFWIGSRGLSAVLRSHDGRAQATSLTAAAERLFGTVSGLHIRLHSGERPVNAIAQFAREVLVAASNADPVAESILDQAAQELGTTALAGIAAAGESAQLALGGRLLASDSPLRARLDRLLAVQPFTTRSADAGPLHGAILLGRSDDLGHYSSLVHRLKAGRPT